MLFLRLQVHRGVRLLFSRRNRCTNLPWKSSIEIEILGTSYECVGKSAIVRSRGTHPKAYLVNCSENIPRIINYKRFKMASIAEIFITHCSWRNISGISAFMLKKWLRNSESGNFYSTMIHGTTETVDFLKCHGQNASNSSILKTPIRDDYFEISAMVFTPSPEDLQDIELLGSRASSVSYHFKDLQIMNRHASFIFIENPSVGHVKAMLTSEEFKESLNVNPPKLVIHFTERDLREDVAHRNFMELFPVNCEHIFVDGRNDAEAMFEMNKRQASLHHFVNRRIYPLLAHQPSHEFPVDPSKVHQILSDPEWKKIMNSIIDLMKLEIIPLGSQGHFNVLNLPSVERKFLGSLKLEGMTNSWSAFPAVIASIDAFGEPGKLKLNAILPFSMSATLAVDVAQQKLSRIDKTRSLQQSILDTVEELQRDGKLPTVMADYPRMVFLGTGATTGSLVRNCSGLLLRLSKGDSILLDCGDGIMSRLCILYGKEVGQVLLGIRYVFVTHIHRDHFSGLNQILQYRKFYALKTGQQVPKICVVANPNLDLYLRTIDTSLGIGSVPEYEFRSLPDDEEVENRPVTFCLEELGVEVDAVPVIHSIPSFGFVVRHHSGWKMVYSGDTMPCKGLVEAGKDCDLLIHEATLDSHHTERAVTSMHSTTDDAVKVGLDMAAKHIILTHFTQGYRLTDHLEHVPDHVSFASDFMQVTLDDLPYLRQLKKIMPLLMKKQPMIHEQYE